MYVGYFYAQGPNPSSVREHIGIRYVKGHTRRAHGIPVLPVCEGAHACR